MKNKTINSKLQNILSQAAQAELEPLSKFLKENPSQPLIATGSGGAETAADFACLLYEASGGIGKAVTPYTLNSVSNNALRTAKLLLVSAGGHNGDIVFAAQRGLAINPENTASISFSESERNLVHGLFHKARSENSFVIPMKGVEDGFVSSGSALCFFSLLTRIFQPEVDLLKYAALPEKLYTLQRNDNSPLMTGDFKGVSNFIILQGSWGRPVAWNLEGKLVECGLSGATVYDFRNYCHGRFIFTSNHLEDSAIVMFITPREREIAKRIRGFLPGSAKLVIIETENDAPEASLDLLIKMTEFYNSLCQTCGVNPKSPKNPGKIDKRRPIYIPFKATLKKSGPLSI